MRATLGVVIGLGCGYLAGSALNESALVHGVLGAGLLLWLVSAYVFGIGFGVWFIWTFIICTCPIMPRRFRDAQWHKIHADHQRDHGYENREACPLCTENGYTADYLK